MAVVALAGLPGCGGRRSPAPPGAERSVTVGFASARSPVLSRDGTTVAFAGVSPGYSNPQIWIVRADGSAPPRPLTTDTSQNYDPDFAPDGRSIYFTSSRQPEGVYRIASTGGQPELVLAGAYAARFSPDGRTLVTGSGGKLVARAQPDGAPVVLLPDIENSYAPVWSPDSTRVLATTTNPGTKEPDWWIAPLSGGPPVHASLADDLRRQGFNYVATHAWLDNNWVVFSGRIGETATLWKVQLNADGTTAGRAVRATASDAGDSQASFAAGHMVFVRDEVQANVWALSFDASGEHVAAPPAALTTGGGRKGQFSVVGSKVLFSGEDGDRFSLFLQSDRTPAKLRDGAFYSLLTPDGSAYVWGEGTKEDLTVSMKSFTWWRFWSTRLCEHCGMPRAFTPDGQRLLLWNDYAPAPHFDLLDLRTRQLAKVVVGDAPLSGPRISPDGRWVSFVAKVGDDWQGFVAAIRDNQPSRSADWVAITPPTRQFFYTFWGARDDLVYVLSSRSQGGNLRFLDAQLLDRATRRPSGQPIAVYEFDQTLVPGMDAIWNPLAVRDRRLILELGGISGGVWIK